MSSYGKCIKYSLIIINSAICVSGLVMLIAGAVTQTKINNQKMATTVGGYSLQAGSILCIIFGIFVFLLGILGAFSTIKGRQGLLNLYSGIMSLIFLIQFITGAVALGVKNSSNFDSYVDKVFAHQIRFNSSHPNERDFYQIYFKCCGWNGVGDYAWPNNTIIAVESCCIEKNCNVSQINELYPSPCISKLIGASRSIIEVAGTILLVFAFFNLTSIVLSILLSRQIKAGYQYQ